MTVITLFFLALISIACGVDFEKENEVVVLTENVFDIFIEQTKFVLVNFYVPWSGHCKALAPEYSKAADILREEQSSIKLAMVEATVETKLSVKYGVQGYPTLKLFMSGKEMDYAGGRTAHEIVAWLKKKTAGPSAKSLKSVEAAAAFQQSADVVVIGFFKDAESDGAKTFINTAFGIDNIKFAITSADAVHQKYEAEDGSVVLFKKFDESRIAFEGDLILADLTSFIRKNSHPLVVEFGDETATKIYGGDIKVHNLLLIKKTSDDFKTIYKEFYEAAATFKGEVLFVLVDGDAEANRRILEYFGLTDEYMPAVRLVTLDGDTKIYKPDATEITTATLTEFVKKFQEGSLKAVGRNQGRR